MKQRVLPILLALVLSCATGAAQMQSAADDGLVGLWGVEQRIGPAVKGELVIRLRGAADDGTATIAGQNAAIKRNGNSLTFTLPADAGKLRAHMSADGKIIAGHWIQPAIAGYSTYASPVVLRSVAKGEWRGVISPLEEPASFYLMIKR